MTVEREATRPQTANDRVDSYLREQTSLDTLRFITCGSVDDGKSTLIGCMLYEAQLIFEDQIATLKSDSKKAGTQGVDIDFALLVDGLAAEREQGITIDVAYRFFSTDRRKFIVADTPGHDRYTRNMVTGASTADVAVILVDARRGLLTQTLRHSIICNTMGIKHVVLAVNKMDLVDYSEKCFRKIVESYQSFASKLSFSSITAIPISALTGCNVIKRAHETLWYSGPTLLGYLESVNVQEANTPHPLRFPVQWVNRPNQDFRGFSGTLESGTAEVGDTIRILPSGETATIREIILFKKKLDRAYSGQSVTFVLDREIDASRGDVIVPAHSPCEISDQFQIHLVWMDREPGYIGRSYVVKIGTQFLNAQITDIRHKFNINTYEALPASKLELNDLYVINVQIDKPVPFEPYKDCVGMGSLILIDRMNNQTVAAGMIDFALRRANNIYYQKLEVNKDHRRRLNGHTSKALWFTGLSGAGKSTIANALERELSINGIRTYLLDGDNVRHGLNKDLGFTDADRVENIRRIGEVAKLMVDAGVVVLVASISPFAAERKMARELFDDGDFIEIYVNTSLEIAEKRDPKGLYRKARNGLIPNFTGINSPYEPPTSAEITVSTEQSSVTNIVSYITKQLKFRT